jgi:hypothetical protein
MIYLDDPQPCSKLAFYIASFFSIEDHLLDIYSSYSYSFKEHDNMGKVYNWVCAGIAGSGSMLYGYDAAIIAST